MKKILLSIFALCLLAMGCADADQGISIVGNTSLDPSIPSAVIGQVNENGEAPIGLTLTVFGASEDDLELAVIDIYVNGGLRYNDIDPLEYYHADSQLVLFTLSPINNEDEIKIDIIKNDVSAATYTGIASDEEDIEITSPDSASE